MEETRGAMGHPRVEEIRGHSDHPQMEEIRGAIGHPRMLEMGEGTGHPHMEEIKGATGHPQPAPTMERMICRDNMAALTIRSELALNLKYIILVQGMLLLDF